MPISYQLVCQAFQFAANSGIRCALVARHASLRFKADFRDIDIIVAPEDLSALSVLLIKQAENAGFRLINVIQNDYSEQLYFQGKHGILHLDLMPRLTYRGIDFLELPLQDHQVQEIDGMLVVSKPWLVAYSVLRSLLWQGKLDERYNEMLDELLVSPDKNAVLGDSLAAAVGHRAAMQILEDIRDPGGIATRSRFIRKAFVWHQLRRRPLQVIAGFVRHAYLLAKRFVHYPGLMVVLLGRGGRENAEVLDGLEAALAEYGTVRPDLASSAWTRSGAMQLTDPAIDSQRNPSSYLPTSVARLHCLFGNSSLGFVKRLWKQLEENRIVLLDRSYYDIFIDFLWCRYSGPHWLARCLVFVTPQPDLWVLLDAPHEVTCTREEQIQENETVRRLEASRSFVSLTKHHAIIDAAQSTNRVVADVHTAIIDTLAQRTNSRFKNRL